MTRVTRLYVAGLLVLVVASLLVVTGLITHVRDEPSINVSSVTGNVAHGILLPDHALSPACDGITQPTTWSNLLVATLRNRNEPASRWTVLDEASSLDLNAYARTNLDAGTVRVSVITPCWVLPSVVTHEAQHLRQATATGLTRAAYRLDPDRYELAADCASRALGSAYVPYVLRASRQSGVHPSVLCSLVLAARHD